MIYELFTMTGFVVWLFLGVWAIGLLSFVSAEAPGWGGFFLGLCALVLFGFTDYRLPPFQVADLAWGAVAYLVGAAAYAGVRWFALVKDLRARFRQREGDIPTMTGVTRDEALTRVKFDLAREFRATRGAVSIPPVVADFKDRFRTWFWFWPMSLLIWLFEDALVKCARAVADFVGEGFDAITKLAWKE